MSSRSGEPVLVTGATGFIGGCLARGLVADGVAVRALVRGGTDPARLPDDLELVPGDLTDGRSLEGAVEGCALVYHVAAVTSSRNASNREIEEVNVQGSSDMAAAAAQAGVRRFVHVSTCGVYGHRNRFPADESTPMRPDTPYRVSKARAERAVLEAARNTGMSVVVARLASIYGPNAKNWLPICRSIRTNRFRMIGDGRNPVHLGHVFDIVDGLRRCGETPGIERRCYNLAAAEPMAIGDLVASLDDQSLPTSEFSVVFIDQGHDERTASRLRRLAERRPNVRVARGDDEARTLLGEGAVALLRTSDVLVPDALARTVAFLDADVVVGSRLDEALTVADAPFAAHRIAYLQGQGLDPLGDKLQRTVAALTPTVAVLDEPVLRGPGGWNRSGALWTDALGWSGDVLTLSVDGLSGVDLPPQARVSLVARHAGDSRQVRLPSTTTGTALSSSFAPDVEATRLGLNEGRWHLRVEITAHGRQRSLPLRTRDARSAVVRETVVSVVDHRDGLVVWVGEARPSVLRFDAPAARCHERASGTLLTLPLVDLHVDSPSAGGDLLIGPIVVPARIVLTPEGSPALQSFVSGMPGRYPLSTRFGATAVPLGHDLVVDGVGAMTLSPTPETPSPRPAGRPGQTRPPAPRGAPGALQRLRRASPERLVHAVAGIPGARRAYRRLAHARDSR